MIRVGDREREEGEGIMIVCVDQVCSSAWLVCLAAGMMTQMVDGGGPSPFLEAVVALLE